MLSDSVVSVAVQTDESAFNVSGPVMIINQEVQVGEQKLQETTLPSHLPDQPVFLSPCKSAISSMTESSETTDEDFDFDTDSSDDSESENVADEDFKHQLVKGKKFLVYESQLDKLFSLCPQCCCPISEVSKRTTGTMITIQY
jgi:hypothetical protein